MSYALPLVLLLVTIAVVGVLLRPVRTDPRATPSESWLGAAAHANRVSVTAWIALLVVPVLGMACSGSLPGFALGLLPALAGSAFLAVHALGEQTWPRPRGAVRRAPLERRRVRDVAPIGLSRLVVGWTAALALLLIVGGLTADDDGRSLTVQLSPNASSAASPYPGSAYGGPIGIAVLVVLAGCVGVLLLVVRRPAVSDTLAVDDLALRRSSARRVLAGVQLVVAWTLAGCLFLAAGALQRTQGGSFDGVSLGSPVVTAVGVVGMLAALAIGIVGVVVAVRAIGAPQRPAPLAQRAEHYRQPEGQPRLPA